MELCEIESALEGILFASGEPVAGERIASVMGIALEDVQNAAASLEEKYRSCRRGIRLVQMKGSMQLCSAPEHYDLIMAVMETRSPPKLSQAALEVLSIVAYFQPATRAYIDQLRGVDSAYTVAMLCDRGLIESCGRLDVPGRPAVYRTTDLFLRTMGIKQLDELPVLPDLSCDEGQAALAEKIGQMKNMQSDTGRDSRTGEQGDTR